MGGDYLELSQFPYNSHQFPYNSYPIPLRTTRFLTDGNKKSSKHKYTLILTNQKQNKTLEK